MSEPLIRRINREQMMWRAVDVEQLIGEDHPARAIWELVGRLDVDGFYADIECSEEQTGTAPVPPARPGEGANGNALGLPYLQPAAVDPTAQTASRSRLNPQRRDKNRELLVQTKLTLPVPATLRQPSLFFMAYLKIVFSQLRSLREVGPFHCQLSCHLLLENREKRGTPMNLLPAVKTNSVILAAAEMWANRPRGDPIPAPSGMTEYVVE
jgi:hypothetical protein